MWLPAWSQRIRSQRFGRWHHPVGASEFRFAVIVLTAAGAAAALAANIGGKGSLGAYLVCGYAVAMLLNVVFPHLLASLAMREYAPGTLTALLLNAPACALAAGACVARRIRGSQGSCSGPARWSSLGIVGSIPLLFAVGRRLRGSGRPGQKPRGARDREIGTDGECHPIGGRGGRRRCGSIGRRLRSSAGGARRGSPRDGAAGELRC